jgi:VIT1/CCC1 family predicted Fe2+/Mn2+ transporter
VRRGAANPKTDVVERRSERIDAADLAGELSAWAAGLGIITVALFPLAVPLIALTALAALPLLLLALVAALLALPFLAIRGLVRRVRAHRRAAEGVATSSEHEPMGRPQRGLVEITR